MAIQQELKSETAHVELLHSLLAERGLTRYGLFAVTGEGSIAPDGYEETSGYALTNAGDAYFFWTGWGETEQRTIFEIWRRSEPQAEWQGDEEYQAARVAAGLT